MKSVDLNVVVGKTDFLYYSFLPGARRHNGIG